MGKFIDLTGMKFGSLTVMKRDENWNGKLRWICICDCGGQCSTYPHSLKNGHTKSCGCLQRINTSIAVTTHGKSRTKEYRAWSQMIRRCYKENETGYEYYGGRGIKVCDSWREKFINFFNDMGEKPTQNHSIDRINVNGNYEPGNCKWATATEQAINQRIDPRNSSGRTGVSWDKRDKKWVAQMKYGSYKFTGYYNSFDEAVEARELAERKYWNNSIQGI